MLVRLATDDSKYNITKIECHIICIFLKNWSEYYNSIMIATINNNFLATWILGCGGCCLCSGWRRLPAVVIANSGAPFSNPGAVLRGLILTWARYGLQKQSLQGHLMIQ